jgi:hypothetical protein
MEYFVEPEEAFTLGARHWTLGVRDCGFVVSGVSRTDSGAMVETIIVPFSCTLAGLGRRGAKESTAEVGPKGFWR